MKVLGLDLGSNSIGWAIIEEKTENVIDMGVRIFQEGVENYGQGEREESPNQARSNARQMRVQYERKRLRRRQLRTKCQTMGIWPATELEKKLFQDMNPWQLRAKAVAEELTKMELARIWLHLCHLRGYKSNGSGDGDAKTIYKGKDKDGVKMTGIDATEAAWKDQTDTYPTAGSYLASLESSETRIRARYTLRKWFIEEFEYIWKVQKAFHPELLTEDNLIKLRDKIIFLQRPLKSQADKIGDCKYEKTEKRAPKAHPLTQIFIMYQQLNNLEIWRKTTPKDKFILSPDQRKIIIGKLLETDKLEIKQLLSSIKLSEEEYKTNYDSQKKISGVPFGKLLKSLLDKKVFGKIDEDKIISTYEFISQSELDQDALLTEIQNDFQLDREKALTLLDYNGPKGYAELSKTAMYNILQKLREIAPIDNPNGIKQWKVIKYDEACTSLYGNHNLYDEKDKAGKRAKLPPPPAVANPVVLRILTELRNTINSIIDHYGKPDYIRLEMARDVKATKEKRQEIISTQGKNRDRNDEIRTDLLKELKKDWATHSEITRYKLWIDQDKKCIYTGKPIGIEDLFDSGKTDIDHIWPKSITRDDSYSNKVLCFREANAKKGQMTPKEWLGGTNQYDEILRRAQNLDKRKYEKFYKEDMQDLEGFISQQLNDTRYATRLAKEYLSYIIPYKDIQGSRGTYTHDLRNSWFSEKKREKDEAGNFIGIQVFSSFLVNPILDAKMVDIHPDEFKKGKSRLDHRHHALDALVIALTSQSLIQKMNKKELNGNGKVGWPLPWLNLPIQAKEHLANIIISYRKRTKPNGQLHQETIYGKIQVPPKTTLAGTTELNEVTVIRKALKDLTKDMLVNIVDGEVKHRVMAYIQNKDPTWKSGDALPKDWHKEAVIAHKNGFLIKKVRVASNNPSLRLIRVQNSPGYVDPHGNHHAVIYVNNETGKYRGEVNQLIDVARKFNLGKKQEKPRRLNAIMPNPKANEEFVCSLMINDLVYLNPEQKLDLLWLQNKKHYKNFSESVFRVQKLDATALLSTLRQHLLAKISIKTADNPRNESVGRQFLSFSKYNVFNSNKLSIDPAGFLTLSKE